MAHKNAACHAREHNRYNVFLGAYACNIFKIHFPLLLCFECAQLVLIAM